MKATGGMACGALCILAALVSAQQLFWPARYRGGGVPTLPKTTVGGGEVFVELDVDRGGEVDAVRQLRTTPPFGDLVAEAARTWQFAPAEELAAADPRSGDPTASRVPVLSKVLVAALFRAPTFNTPTLGEPARDVATASDELAVPVSTVAPPFPPTAFSGGVVLLEASVDGGGLVDRATVLRSAPPFDAAARAALLQWRFRPARRHGQPVPALVYVMFGFAVPIG